MANIADDISHAYQDGYNDGYEKGKADAEFYLLHCGDTDEPYTNADRIRSMTDEELAEWLSKNDPECDTPEWWLRWLKEDVSG